MNVNRTPPNRVNNLTLVEQPQAGPNPTAAGPDHEASFRQVLADRVQLHERLSRLQELDRAGLQHVLSSIARDLQAKAEQGGWGADRLVRLAERYERAAGSGDLRALRPAWMGGASPKDLQSLCTLSAFDRLSWAGDGFDFGLGRGPGEFLGPPFGPRPGLGLGGLGLVPGSRETVASALSEADRLLAAAARRTAATSSSAERVQAHPETSHPGPNDAELHDQRTENAA